MRHNFYINCNNHGVRARGKQIISDFSRQPPRQKNKTFNRINKNFVTLDNLASTVLEKYHDDPIMRDEIVGKINIYCINFTIAKELNNEKTQKELTKGIRNYLYTLLKKEN